MKLKQKALLLGISSVLASVDVYALTCTIPYTPFQQPNAQAIGDTCTGSNIIGTYCGVANSPQPEHIYSVTLNNPTATQIAMTNVGAGFSGSMVLFQGTCVNGDNCAANAISPGAGQPVNLDITGIPNGNYFLAIVADPNAAAGNCGTYQINANGTLPVELQSFSVE